MIAVTKILYLCHTSKKTVEALNNPKLDYCDLTFVHEGHFDYCINGERFAVVAGEGMFCVTGGSRIRYASHEPTRYTSINFVLATDPRINLPGHFQTAFSPPVKFYLGQLVQAYFSDDPVRAEKCHMLLALIVQQLAEINQQAGYSTYIDDIKRYIAQHFSGSVRVADIAASVSLNPSYCSTIFKQREGVAISDYLTAIRIRHAQDLLRHDTASITEIAAQAGFCDVYYFSRVFRRQCGLTPTAYRRQASAL